MATQINFYKDGDLWIFDDTIRTPGTLLLNKRNEARIVIMDLDYVQLFAGSPMDVLDKDGNGRANVSALVAQVGEFFEGPASGGGSPDPDPDPDPEPVANAGVIDMQPGEYLMDVINAINALPENEKPTESNPLTINMYNHNFTVDYDRITAKVVIPKHVYIHLAGNYSCFVWDDDAGENVQLPQKSFIGFDFSGASPRSLPMMSLAFSPYNFHAVNLEADIPNGSFDEYLAPIFVYAKDTKKLLLVRGAEIIDVTVILQYYTVDDARLGYFGFVDCQSANFSYVDCKGSYFGNADCQHANFNSADCNGANFYIADCESAKFNRANCQGAYFGSANCQGADFSNADCQGARFDYADCKGARFDYTDCKGAGFNYADCKGANFSYVDCKGAYFDGIQLNNQCNFQGANLTNVKNMPATLNTKAKFIAVVGAGNVNAQTIWIDGTSILS